MPQGPEGLEEQRQIAAILEQADERVWAFGPVVKVAHLRLCHSRMPFVRAYPRESQEMVFDGHDRAFAFFKGTCTRGIYDNMKTAVDAVFVGKERAYNRRFLQMCGHYLVEPVACTPGAGWVIRGPLPYVSRMVRRVHPSSASTISSDPWAHAERPGSHAGSCDSWCAVPSVWPWRGTGRTTSGRDQRTGRGCPA